ncbi:hypothetical protein KHC28_15525 [Ancylobacter sonchi]|uniref:hypothetical protein n=1 Tax=Ancylobacter sonchi TaxID=1937790 RepID=UPI001BD23455|nr:hypothetical protein [Ancylobacter sonchi]MBS7535064.1 hypothetical protein [Ancylobacter sonchi]
MNRVLASILSMVIVIGAGHFIRANLHGGGRPAQASAPARSRTPFEQCMARAKKSFGPGTLPEAIKRQFTLDCEAQFGR